MPGEANKALIERLERRHPLWEANRSSWDEINDVVNDGVKNAKDKYLPRSAGETVQDYENRKFMARFKGETPTNLERLAGTVTRQGPKRSDPIAREFGDFMSNVDGCGTSLDEHNEDALLSAMAFGAHFVIVDRPQTDPQGNLTETTSKGFEEVEEERQAETSDMILVSHNRIDLVDWSVDRCGEFHWIRILKRVRRAATPEEKPIDVEEYTEWDRTSWRRFHVFTEDKVKKVEEVAQGNHNLGIVPIAICWLFRSSRPMDYQSVIRYAYHNDLLAFQAEADLTYNAWKHAQGTINDARQTAKTNRVQTGPNAVNKLEPDEKLGYMDFPTGILDAHKSRSDSAQASSKRLMGIDVLGGSDDPSALAASGRARAFSFSVSEERILRRSGKALERYEKRIFEISKRWESSEDDISPRKQLNEEVTTYPTTFNSEGSQEKIDSWLATRSEINSDTYDKEAQKEIVTSVLGTTPPDTKKQIMEEIETNPLIGKDEGEGVEDEEQDPNDAEDASVAMDELDDLQIEELVPSDERN